MYLKVYKIAAAESNGSATFDPHAVFSSFSDLKKWFKACQLDPTGFVWQWCGVGLRWDHVKSCAQIV